MMIAQIIAGAENGMQECYLAKSPFPISAPDLLMDLISKGVKDDLILP